MFEEYARQDAEHTRALHEALVQVRIEQEAEHYAEVIRRIIQEEEAKPMKLSSEDYKMLEFGRKSERLIHIKPSDIKELIDLALDRKDFKWALKLQKQRELMEGLKKK